MANPSLLSVSCLMIGFGILTPAVAQALDEAPQDSGAALEQGRQALKLFEAGDFRGAYEGFAEAERLMHSPVFVLYMARSLRELGQWSAAKALFERTTAEKFDAGAPQVWKDAAREAALELATLRRRMPSVRILIGGSPRLPLTLEAGTESRQMSESELLLELEPGERTLTLTDSNGVSLRRRIQLRPGQQEAAVRFEFPPAARNAGAGQKRVTPSEPAKQPNGVRGRRDAAPPTAETGSTNWGALTAFGLGAAALTSGAAAGFIALIQTNQIKDNCVDNRCLLADRQKADTARRWANLSTVGFVVGTISVGAGLTLFLSTPSSPGAVTVRVSPASVAISGNL